MQADLNPYQSPVEPSLPKRPLHQRKMPFVFLVEVSVVLWIATILCYLLGPAAAGARLPTLESLSATTLLFLSLASISTGVAVAQFIHVLVGRRNRSE